MVDEDNAQLEQAPSDTSEQASPPQSSEAPPTDNSISENQESVPTQSESIISPEAAAPATEEVTSSTISEPLPHADLQTETQQPDSPAPPPVSEPTQVSAQTVPSSSPNIIAALLAKAQAKIQERKRKKLDKIMGAFPESGKISNADLKKLLHVSDATATRYLEILEKENLIRQVGKTGHAVFYQKVT